MKRNSNKFEKMNPSSIQIILSATLPAILPKKLSLKRRKSGNYQNPTAFVLINRQQVAGRRPISFFQALGSRGSAKPIRRRVRETTSFPPRCFSCSPFFRSSPTAESLELANGKNVLKQQGGKSTISRASTIANHQEASPPSKVCR